jgi:hypothetical protein
MQKYKVIVSMTYNVEANSMLEAEQYGRMRASEDAPIYFDVKVVKR